LLTFETAPFFVYTLYNIHFSNVANNCISKHL